MKRMMMVSAIALLAVLSFAPVAFARGRVFIGGGYGFYGPAYYGGYGPGWYGAGWYGPYGGPYNSYNSRMNAGKVKIVTPVKGDSIFVDGGFAGITGKLKKFTLRPGTHVIELRDHSGHAYYKERVEVIRGQTVELKPALHS